MRYHLYKRITRFQRYIASRVTQTGKLFCVMVMIAGFFGLNTEKSMFFQFFPVLFCFIVFGFLLSIRFTTKVTCKRILPETCVAGQKLNYYLHINNPAEAQNGIFFQETYLSPIPTKAEYDKAKNLNISSKSWIANKLKIAHWLSLFPKEKNIIYPEIEFPTLLKKQAIEVDAHLLPLKRGSIHIDGYSLFRKDPLGLFKKTIFHTDPQNILVLPKLYPAPQLKFEGSRKYHQGGLNAATDQGDSEEFVSLREYTAGDPLKKIDWKSTARTRQLIVKQFKNEYFSRYGLILDTFTDEPDSIVFESAVSIAASLIMAQNLKDEVMDLMFVGDKFYIETVGKGMSDQHQMLKILASVEPCKSSRFNELTSLLKNHINLVSGLVIILADFDKKRHALLDYVASLQIPHRTICISEHPEIVREDVKSAGNRHPILFVEPDKITEQLAQL